MSSFEFNTTKSIINECGGLSRIVELCQSINITNPLIVTDQGIVKCGLLSKFTQILESKMEFSVFDEVVADPMERTIAAALTNAKQTRVDGVIGFGGGSSMDTAKIVAVLINGEQQLTDIYGVGLVKGKRAPLILIPTTAGTGSEVTPIAIVTTGETTKAGVVSPQLLPDIALLDAQLTTGLPPHITAATGIDAMVHAIEAFTSKFKKNPYSDILAKEALSLLSANIECASQDGTNLKARQNMLLGSCLAGQAFANAPVAAVHALAYPLGGHFHIPHGLSNSLVLPHVMRFNLQDCADSYKELASCIHEDLTLDGPSEQLGERLITYMEGLIYRLNLPTTLKELGIKAEQLPMLAKDALLQQRLLVNNPRQVSYQDALNIYRASYGDNICE